MTTTKMGSRHAMLATVHARILYAHAIMAIGHLKTRKGVSPINSEKLARKTKRARTTRNAISVSDSKVAKTIKGSMHVPCLQ